MAASRFKHRFIVFFQAVRLWLLLGVGLAGLCFLYYFLANLGPRKVNEQSITISTPDDPVLARLSNEIDELEKRYRQSADAGIFTKESVDALEAAVEKQKELLRTFSHAGMDQSSRLARLETELDNAHAREKVIEVDQLESEGQELLDANKIEEAGVKLREALRLQREINLSAASSRYKNYVRETALTHGVAAVEAAPLRQEMEAALASARSAAANERWAEALTAYTAARDAQSRINREYGRTRYADIGAVDRLNAEIESLNAAGVATEIETKEKQGDEAVRAGRSKIAAELFQEAGALQLKVNQNYPRSRFVSSQRIEDLEVKRQTALSMELADALDALDRAIGQHLRKRQVVAAEQKVREAGEMVERLFTEFPKSRRLDGALRIKLAYLSLRRADLRALQDAMYENLLPMPGAVDWLLMKTEVSQSLYVLVMNTNPSRNPGRSLPVDSVNWRDAQEFCTRLSWIMGATVRLPSLNEFRVALGPDGGGGAWHRRNSDGQSREVGSQAANADGFNDLLGNVAEWANATDASAEASIVGGSYLDDPEALKKMPVETRMKNDRARHVGFRVLVEL